MGHVLSVAADITTLILAVTASFAGRTWWRKVHPFGPLVTLGVWLRAQGLGPQPDMKITEHCWKRSVLKSLGQRLGNWLADERVLTGDELVDTINESIAVVTARNRIQARHERRRRHRTGCCVTPERTVQGDS